MKVAQAVYSSKKFDIHLRFKFKKISFNKSLKLLYNKTISELKLKNLF